MGKAGAGIDMQAGEEVVVGQADLQDGQITLKPLLLVVDQVGPPATDGLNRGR